MKTGAKYLCFDRGLVVGNEMLVPTLSSREKKINGNSNKKDVPIIILMVS